MAENRQYDQEYKVQTVKLAKEIGQATLVLAPRHQALLLRQPEHVSIPSERTVYRVMEELGLSQCGAIHAISHFCDFFMVLLDIRLTIGRRADIIIVEI